jgi:hypothetical protein
VSPRTRAGVGLGLIAGAARVATADTWQRLTGRRAAIPASAADVTPEWLTSRLVPPGSTTSVIGVEVLDHTEGTTSRVRARLDVAGDAAGLPDSVFVKLTPGLSHRLLLTGLGLIEGEVRFYRLLRPGLPARAPDVHSVDYDAASQRFALVLDDLAGQGASFGLATEPLDAAGCARVLDELAVLHGELWCSPRLDRDLRWLQSPTRGRFHDFYRVVPMGIGRGLARAGSLVPAPLRDPARLLDAYRRLQARNDEPPATVLHGDPHLGNLYFDASGAAGLLDWQVVRRGSWAHDVGYFLVSALDVHDRMREERGLLAHYLDRLGERVADAPSLDDAWDRYRLQAIYGLCMWLGTLALGDYQAEAVCRANVERYAAAALDHGALESLGSRP